MSENGKFQRPLKQFSLVNQQGLKYGNKSEDEPQG